MHRRAGIHRVAAVVARRLGVDGGSPARGPEGGQLDLFARAAAIPLPPDEGRDAPYASSEVPGVAEDAAFVAGPRVVAPCPACSWWVEAGEARCNCCGVALDGGAIAPQTELVFVASLATRRPAPFAPSSPRGEA